jgi:hypothetical protein
MAERDIIQVEEARLRIGGGLPRILMIYRQILYTIDPTSTPKAIRVVNLPVKHAEQNQLP